jgi:hypothetical protein
MTEHKRHFAICVDNADYEASLILRKIYAIIPDEAAARDDLSESSMRAERITSIIRAIS